VRVSTPGRRQGRAATEHFRGRGENHVSYYSRSHRLRGIVLVGAFNADAASTRHKELQTVPIGNKLSAPLYREASVAPYALTGDLERAEPTRCKRELRTGANKVTTLARACSPR
jgi:hypothetical protein